MNKEKIILADLGKYKPETVRYAAYSLSGDNFVVLRPGAKKTDLAVVFSYKPGRKADAGLEKKFRAELEAETLRAKVAAAGAGLREFLYLKALSAPVAAAPDSGLTREQELELDSIIAQVEKEIKTEASGRHKKDPLGIARTWEEANDKRSVEKRKK